MALIPKLSVCFTDKCSVLEIKETTGSYSNPSNLGGWGSPNVTLPSVTEAVLTITYPNDEQESIDITDIINAATITNGEFEINTYNPEDLNMSEFSDGIYVFEYTITVDDVVYSTTVKTLILCKTRCCVDNMLSKAIDKYLCGSNCKTDAEIIEALKARALLLQAIKWSFSCNKLTQAKKLLDQANKICKQSGDCGCGCS